jgi:hypothetical protein
VVWKQTALQRKPTYAINSSNTYASETPVTDGERVYAYFGARYAKSRMQPRSPRPVWLH